MTGKRLIAVEVDDWTYVGEQEEYEPAQNRVVIGNTVRVPTVNLSHNLIDSLSNSRVPVGQDAENIFRIRAYGSFRDGENSGQVYIHGTERGSFIIHPIEDEHIQRYEAATTRRSKASGRSSL